MRILIVTAGGLPREFHGFFHNLYNFAGFLDTPRCEGETINGLPVTTKHSPDMAYVLVVGNPKRKRELDQELAPAIYPTIIHPTAFVSPWATLDEGCVVCPYGLVASEARLGRHVYVSYMAMVAHSVKVGDYSTINLGSIISDYSSLGVGVFVGVGAHVVKRAHVGDWSVIGAGAVVTKDVPPNTVVAGVPAKVLRKLEC